MDSVGLRDSRLQTTIGAQFRAMNHQLWNREELYAEVWEQPLTKLASKYGISAVAIGKICRKLKIPLPGRGYWARKQFGQNPKKSPLPRFDDPPRLTRPDIPPTEKPEVDSIDPELIKIAEIEAAPILAATEEHKFVTTARRILLKARTDEYERVQKPPSQSCLDIHVSKELLERALAVINTLLFALEANGLTAQVSEKATFVEVFGQTVSFGIEEDLHVKERRKETSYWGRERTTNVYARSGVLAFRIWSGKNSGERQHWGDGKNRRLEDLLPRCLGGLLRIARHNRIAAEEQRRWQLQWEQQERERQERARKAQEEQARLKNLEDCMVNWHKAQQIREFVLAFEKSCEAKGQPFTPDSPNGEWMAWARKKADSFDPLVAK